MFKLSNAPTVLGELVTMLGELVLCYSTHLLVALNLVKINVVSKLQRYFTLLSSIADIMPLLMHYYYK